MAQSPAPTPNTQHPTPISDYRRLLADYQAATAQGLTAGAAKELRARFEAVKAVRLDDGKTITPDNSGDIELLKATEKRGKARKDPFIKTRGALLNEVNAAPTGSVVPVAKDPKAQVKTILAGKEFAPADQEPAQKNWLAQALQWINTQWTKFWNWLFGRRGAMKPVPWLAQLTLYILYGILAVAALVALFFLVRFIVNRFANWEGRTDNAKGEGIDLLFDIADPLSAAQESAAQGDYRTALRLAYIASLRRLAATGYLVLQENRTNWEYQSSLRRRSHDAYAALLPATRLFDAIWYGNRPATATEYQAVTAAHDTLPNAPYSAESNDVQSSAQTAATMKGNRW